MQPLCPQFLFLLSVAFPLLILYNVQKLFIQYSWGDLLLRLLIRGGRAVDPARGVDDTLDILIDEGRIVQLGKHLETDGAQALDASGLAVAPGLVDMHVHFRDLRPRRRYPQAAPPPPEAA